MEVIEKVIDFAYYIGFQVRDLEHSPIKGPEGNIEYLGYLRKNGGDNGHFDLNSIVEASHADLKEA